MNEIKYVEDGVEYSICQGSGRMHEIQILKDNVVQGRISITNLFKIFGV